MLTMTCRGLRLFSSIGMMLLLLRGAVSAQQPGAAVEFEGIEQASIDTSDGMPRLMINGKPRVPLVFWFNQKQNPDFIERFQDPQVKLSAEAGVHIYGTMVPSPDIHGAHAQAEFAEVDAALESFVKADPQAVFIPRIWPGPNPSWTAWAKIPPDHLSAHADGSKSDKISIASEYYWELSNEGLTALIRHLEDGPYGNRILAYNIGGPEFEMFPYMFREKGPDVSPVSQRRFREWLGRKYKDDAALRQAWGSTTVTIETAAVPIGEPGRFPMHNNGAEGWVKTFYQLPAEQNWLDYSAFVSDLAADRLINWAELIKKQTNNRKLGVFCYGYSTELIGSFGAHGAIERVLEHPAFDILMSPIPYRGREPGDAAGFMSLVDSVALHGKLWLNEDDIRTSVVKKEDIPYWLSDETFAYRARDLNETLNLIDRNLGNLIIHRTTAWLMDLAGGGAFNDPAIWRMVSERMKLYGEMYAQPTPYQPEVAMILDPQSRNFVKSDWDAWYWMLTMVRNHLGRSGAAVGYYSLSDFISGKAPRCKAYVFVFTFDADAARREAIQARLKREQATAIWLYAPGAMGPEGVDVERASALTGMALGLKDGNQGIDGQGALEGIHWGAINAVRSDETFNVSPRFHVTDAHAKTLGRYAGDGLTGAARKEVDGYTSVFIGSLTLTWPVLNKLFTDAGAHLWTEDGSVVQTDGKLLMIHSGAAGLKRIRLPQGRTAEAITGKIEREERDAIFVRFEAGETLWFRLHDAKANTGAQQ